MRKYRKQETGNRKQGKDDRKQKAESRKKSLTAFCLLPSAFCLLFTIFCFLFSCFLFPVFCMAQQDELTDFPKRIEIKIEDPTQVLSQRRMFVDLETPQLFALRRVQPKERAWGLPPIMTPAKVETEARRIPKPLLIWFTAQPSFPESLFYNALFAKEFKSAKSLITFDRQTLSDKRTKGRGVYNFNNLDGDVGSSFGVSTDLRLDISYKTKDLGWLDSNHQIVRRNLTLVDVSSALKGVKSSEFQWSASFSGSDLRFASDASEVESASNSNSNSKATWLNLRIDANAIWPFLNPIDFGGGVEHFSTKLSAISSAASESRQVTDLRLYAKDNFISLSPFVFKTGVELAAVSMRNDIGQEHPKIFVNPSLSALTEVGDHVKIEVGADRNVARHRLDQLYFYQDFSELNPFLETEREWRGNASLKVDFGSYLSTQIGASRRVVDGLIVYERDKGRILSWKPVNLNAKVDSIQMGVQMDQDKGLRLNVSFWHEFQRGNFRLIPYQPEDRLELAATYPIEHGFNFGIEAEYVGKRAKDTSAVVLLPAYLLWKPQISKSFGNYAIFFLKGILSVGTYQIRDGYDLPQQLLDAGFTLKF